jgi:ABC-type transport system involved in cytochrome bd biosynthesis fused ATPase/permease subunit
VLEALQGHLTVGDVALYAGLVLTHIATRIIVMEHGQIVEQGTHDELMKAGNGYWAMFTRQASRYLDLN